jgi:hypothetical protein
VGKEEDNVRSQIDAAASRISDEFAEAMQWLRDRHTLEEFILAVKTHRLDAILNTDDIRTAAQRMADAVNIAYGDAGQEVADQISSWVSGDVAFDMTNRWAVSRTTQNSLRLIRDVTQEQRQTIRDALADAVEQGLNPRQAAVMLRDSIGLTPAQQEYVSNYRQSLQDGSARALDYELRDRRYDAATRRGDLTDSQIETMTSRYQQRLLNYRAEVIARTESMRAVHEGATDMWRQATASGDVDSDSVVRTWRTSHDGRVRASHRAMDGQQASLGDAFRTGDGVELEYPGDPDAPPEESIQCRCVVVTRIRRAS